MKKTQQRRQRPLPPVTRSKEEIRDSLRGAIDHANKVRKHYQKCGFAVVRDPSKLKVGKSLLDIFRGYALRLEQANQAVINEKTTLNRLVKQLSDEEAMALKATEKVMTETWATEAVDANEVAE